MKPRSPRFAIRLLERFAPESGPLAGDLLEAFDAGRSRAWLWWQVLAAIALAVFRQPAEIRPLRLVDLQPADAVERWRAMSTRWTPVNLGASPVRGVGGLGLIVLSMLTTWIVPGIWMVLVASSMAGVVLGVVLIGRRRPA